MKKDASGFCCEGCGKRIDLKSNRSGVVAWACDLCVSEEETEPDDSFAMAGNKMGVYRLKNTIPHPGFMMVMERFCTFLSSEEIRNGENSFDVAKLVGDLSMVIKVEIIAMLKKMQDDGWDKKPRDSDETAIASQAMILLRITEALNVNSNVLSERLKHYMLHYDKII